MPGRSAASIKGTLLTTSSSISSIHLRFEGVSLSFGDRRVLTDITFDVSVGETIGLIGENGSGKTTLLKIAAGLLHADSGAVEVAGARRAASVGLLHQDAPFAPTDTVTSALEAAVWEARAALRDIDSRAKDLALHPEESRYAEAYAAALERAEYLDVWDIDARISSTLAGLGLGSIERSRTIERLSGGQRARLALAWTLLRAPDVLLLDEPTNHLDEQAVEYLIGVLRSWKGPVLAASHDRSFLNAAVTGLIDLDPKPLAFSVASHPENAAASGFQVTRFTGNYTDYLLQQASVRERWERQYREEQAELRKLRAGVRENQQVGHANWKPRTEVRMAQKFYADRNARVVARRVNDTKMRLEKLSERQVRKPPKPLRFSGLTSAGRPNLAAADGADVVNAHQVAVTHRLKPVSFSLAAGEKLLVTGANGSGKSTLLHLIAGLLQPDHGTLTIRSGAAVGHLHQDVARATGPKLRQYGTAREFYAAAVGSGLAEETPLSTFGLLHPRDENQAVEKLSLGQLRRLQLAVLLAKPPDILLLDEPTNHLSLPLVSAIEAAIPSYPGAVIIASHDRWLRDGWTGRQIAIEARDR